MKKEYSKPQIMFENFALSTSIAATCEVINSTPTLNSCSYIDLRDPTGLQVFMTGIGGCTRKEDDGEYNGICYHNPSDNNLFNS